MKKLMVSAFALAMMTTGAMAGEQLTTAQLDQVTAGGVFIGNQVNLNVTKQRAVAVNKQKCFACNGGAAAANYNGTTQFNID